MDYKKSMRFSDDTELMKAVAAEQELTRFIRHCSTYGFHFWMPNLSHTRIYTLNMNFSKGVLSF